MKKFNERFYFHAVFAGSWLIPHGFAREQPRDTNARSDVSRRMCKEKGEGMRGQGDARVGSEAAACVGNARGFAKIREG